MSEKSKGKVENVVAIKPPNLSALKQFGQNIINAVEAYEKAEEEEKKDARE